MSRRRKAPAASGEGGEVAFQLSLDLGMGIGQTWGDLQPGDELTDRKGQLWMVDHIMRGGGRVAMSAECAETGQVRVIGGGMDEEIGVMW